MSAISATASGSDVRPVSCARPAARLYSGAADPAPKGGVRTMGDRSDGCERLGGQAPETSATPMTVDGAGDRITPASPD